MIHSSFDSLCLCLSVRMERYSGRSVFADLVSQSEVSAISILGGIRSESATPTVRFR
jgi:hypothetical protein